VSCHENEGVLSSKVLAI